MRVKTFIEALRCYPDHLRKMEKYFNDKRLTVLEKKILKSWLLLRSRKFDEIYELLLNLNSEDLIVESQRELIIGIAYNNNSDPHRALSHLERSVELMKSTDLQREKFVSYFNLFIVYLNLKNQTGMEMTLDVLDDLTPFNVTQELEMGRLKMAYYSFIQDFKKAALYLSKIDANSRHLTEFQVAAFQIDKFIFFVKQGKYKNCEQVLKELKHNKKYVSYGNFLFMKRLLDFVQDKSRLYVYPQDFKEHPILYHQIKLLLALEINDTAIAHIEWKFLQAQSPGSYGENFQYVGDKCLFSIALEKIRNHQKKDIITKLKIDNKGSDLVQAFLETMKKNNGSPVSKDQIYLEIYGELPSSKEDLNKLSCTVKRLRKKYGIEIKSKKGTFTITGKKSA